MRGIAVHERSVNVEQHASPLDVGSHLWAVKHESYRGGYATRGGEVRRANGLRPPGAGVGDGGIDLADGRLAADCVNDRYERD